MAVKFSDFSPKALVSEVTEVVGYLTSGELNVRIPPANLDTTYVVSTGNAGASPTINLQGTKPNQPAISPTSVSLTGSGATLLDGNGSTTINFESTEYRLNADDVGSPGTIPVKLSGSGGGDTGDVSIVNLVGAGGIGITSSSNTITITDSGGGGGTVTSVALDATAFSAFSVSGSPITGSGTLTLGINGGSAGQFLDYTGAWSSPAGGFTSFDITGDNAVTETVGNNDTITFVGGTNIATAVTATDTVTINLDTAATIWTLAGGDGAGTSQAITPGNTAAFKENEGTVVNSVQVGGGVQTKAAATDELLFDQTSEQIVTMVNPGSGNLLYIDGAYQGTIVLPRGFTYEFNQDAASNSGHPIEIGEVLDGSTPYATGIQYYGSASANTLTPVSQADYVSNSTTYSSGSGTARVRIRINQNSPALYYYCSNHSGMGGSIAYGGSSGGFGSINQFQGTGSSLGALTLGSTPAAAQNCLVSISGVTQNYLDAAGSANWTVTSNTLTFAFNPPVTAVNGIQITVIA